MNKLNLSHSTGPASNTTLISWQPTQYELFERLSKTAIGAKDGSYLIRCAGTFRNNETTAHTASLLILDGDSRITEDGEVLPGAPNPKLVHDILTSLCVSHCIFTTHSNDIERHKYRIFIPCEYSREQLPILLNHFHDLLHEDGAMLFNVPENRTWSQAWYFPRVPDQARFELFRFYPFTEGKPLDVEAICREYLEAHPVKAEPPVKPPELKDSDYSGLKINPMQLFNQVWASPVNYLLSQGYKFKGKKLLHPNSTSGCPGVQICRNCKDGRERIYSHNGNDPLNDGYSHDAFDCFKILEHGGNETAALIAFSQSYRVNGKTLEQHNRQLHEAQKAAGKAKIDFNWASMERGV